MQATVCCEWLLSAVCFTLQLGQQLCASVCCNDARSGSGGMTYMWHTTLQYLPLIIARLSTDAAVCRQQFYLSQRRVDTTCASLSTCACNSL